MRELYLSNNEIDNEGAEALIKSIKARRGFKTIDLDNNKFSGDSISELLHVLPVTKLNLIKNILNED